MRTELTILVGGPRDAILAFQRIANGFLLEAGVRSKAIGSKHTDDGMAVWWLMGHGDENCPFILNPTGDLSLREELEQMIHRSPDLCAKWIEWNPDLKVVLDQKIINPDTLMIEVVHRLLYFKGIEPGTSEEGPLPWFTRWSFVTGVVRKVNSKPLPALN